MENIGEIMTMKEIEKCFDQEWVLIENPIRFKDDTFKKGRILWHGKDRDEVYDKAISLKPKRCAFMFVGKRPADLVLVL